MNLTLASVSPCPSPGHDRLSCPDWTCHPVGMLTLYYAPHTCALASHIALEEAGADYQTVRIDFAAQEQRQGAYLAVNPQGARAVPGHRTGRTD